MPGPQYRLRTWLTNYTISKRLIMKKRIIYISIVILFVFATGFILIKSGTKAGTEALYNKLLPRNPGLTPTAEWTETKNNTTTLIQKIKNNPSDIKSLM